MFQHPARREKHVRWLLHQVEVRAVPPAPLRRRLRPAGVPAVL